VEWGKKDVRCNDLANKIQQSHSQIYVSSPTQFSHCDFPCCITPGIKALLVLV
jgi:hypothetical protein